MNEYTTITVDMTKVDGTAVSGTLYAELAHVVTLANNDVVYPSKQDFAVTSGAASITLACTETAIKNQNAPYVVSFKPTGGVEKVLGRIVPTASASPLNLSDLLEATSYGTVGTTAPVGTTWYEGTGAPSGTLGVNGDFYLDTLTGDVYKRVSGSWSVVANLRGAAGIASTTTASAYTVGSISATVTVADGTIFVAGANIAITDGTNTVHARVTARTASTVTFTPVTPKPPADAADAVVIAAGATILVAGAQGATGPTAKITTSGSYTQAAGAIAIPVTGSTDAFAVGQYAVVINGANRISGTLTAVGASSLTFQRHATTSPVETADGTVYASGSTIAGAGAMGPTGATGATGDTGPIGPQGPVSHNLVRNCVMAGAVTAAGLANYLSTPGGRAVSLAGTTTPLQLTFAAGYSSGAPVNYTAAVSADVASAWTWASNVGVVYLYIDRDSGTGTLTYGSSTLRPLASRVAPAAPATDQHWFDLNTGLMKRWTGAAWETKQRVFVGTTNVTGGAATAIASYEFNNRVYVRAYKTATQATSAGADTTIDFDAATDDHGDFSLAANTFTAPEDGLYILSAGFLTTTAFAVGDVIRLSIALSGSPDRTLFETRACAAQIQGGTGAITRRLSAGDVISLKIFTTAAETLAGTDDVWFAISRAGAL